MENLAPLPVAIPLILAALLTVLEKVRGHRRLLDVISLVAALAVTAIDGLFFSSTLEQTIVYWFGGWQPVAGFPVGIAFVIDPLGAGIAALAAMLTAMALIFSWHYFRAIGTFYHSLMLLFLAAMEGFALTGDLFNMFVFFELMGVAAYALTGYKIEDTGPLEGALNFAVMNSIGAFFVLFGIGMLYARTGGLNLAWVGASLAGQQPDAAIQAAFVFLLIGFLVKGAVFPFHFWLPDAHSVAPTPASVLFSGVMVQLGLYAVARIYWTIFHGVIPNHEVQVLFLGLGVVTAIGGAAMCFIQRHLKRLLAFSTVSHSGIMLAGLALVDARAVGGTFFYLGGHGLIKGSLFIMSGIILNHCRSIDEERLRGRCRGQKFIACCYCISALALAGLPPFATFAGKDLVEQQAALLGHHWLSWVFLFSSAVTGGAVLRAGLAIFFNLGQANFLSASAPSLGDHESAETRDLKARHRFLMTMPVVVLIALALVTGIFHEAIFPAVSHGAAVFVNQRGYQAVVLARGGTHLNQAAPAVPQELLNGFIAAGGAVVLALAALFSFKLSHSTLTLLQKFAKPPLRAIRQVHSGHVGDYVTLLMAGSVVVAILAVAV